MSFNNIVWNSKEAVDGYKLNKMINNDNINYQLAIKAPKGLLGAVDLSTLSSASRTLSSAATNININNFGVTGQALTSLSIYNKNLPTQKRLDNTTVQRYYKFNISDLTVDDDPLQNESLPFNALTNPYINQDRSSIDFVTQNSAQRPNDRGFLFRFYISGYNITTFRFDFLSTIKPARHNLSSNVSVRFWRTQSGEFIVPLPVTRFNVNIEVAKYYQSTTGGGASSNRAFRLTTGVIWIEDVGSEPF